MKKTPLDLAILSNAQYPGDEGMLQERELSDLHDRVNQALSTTNGDAGTCVVSTRQLAILLGSVVQNQALKEQIKDVGVGLGVVEQSFAKACKMDPSDAPFPLVGAEAQSHLTGRRDAYQHALEMMNSAELQALIQNNFKEPASAPSVGRRP
jgi:hypothetical protein